MQTTCARSHTSQYLPKWFNSIQIYFVALAMSATNASLIEWLDTETRNKFHGENVTSVKMTSFYLYCDAWVNEFKLFLLCIRLSSKAPTYAYILSRMTMCYIAQNGPYTRKTLLSKCSWFNIFRHRPFHCLDSFLMSIDTIEV